MTLELAIASWVGEWVTVKIASAVLTGVSTQLKPKDIDKALKTCVTIADKQVKLFFCCEPRFIPKFLEQVFHNAAFELQKPLKNEGYPQVEYLVAVFKNVLEEYPKLKQDINESLIKPWLEVFAKKYFETTDLYLRYQVSKENYLMQLVNYVDDIKFAGIAVEGKEVDKSAKLIDIFVMPDVIENVAITNLISLQNFSADTSTHQVAPILQPQQLIQDYAKPFSAQELLQNSKSKKLVLLGTPGSGKTTLMNYFVVKLAQQNNLETFLDETGELLPIIIRIRDLAKYSSNINILEFIQQFANRNLQMLQLPDGFFESWLLDGRTLIILDGLDEVAELSRRYEIVNQIECFLNQFPNNYTVITSRPAGYKRDFFRTEDYLHYTLQSFDDSKINEFINKWYSSRFKDPLESQRWQESLQKALAEQKRIKELARNPLLITIISLIHIYEAYLPRNRHKLYERAVKTLLTNWDAGKELNYKLPFEYLNRDDIQRLMEQLAYWIHTQGGTGDQEGGTLIDKEELVKQLSRFIAEQYHIQRHQAQAEAERFVEYIRERAGLLNEQGQDCYAFVHKTFQEYLAAQEIKDRQEGDGDNIVLEHIEKYLHNPHWHEVLLLLIAQQHRKKTAKFIKYILSYPTPYEQWLHRNLFFAANCLAEDIDVNDDTLVMNILQRLVELEIAYSDLIGYHIKRQVYKSICNLGETKFNAKIQQLLDNSANNFSKVRLQEYRTELGKKGEAIDTLISMLQSQNSIERARAAEALGSLGNLSEEFVQKITHRLRDDDSFVRRCAAGALARLERDDLALQVLMPMLSDKDSSIRVKAVEGLGKLGNNCEMVIQALLYSLEEKELDVRLRASEALGLLGYACDKVVNELILMLESDDYQLRFRAAEVFIKSSNEFKNYQVLVSVLLSKLSDREYMVRLRAIGALLSLCDSSEELIQALMFKLDDEHTAVRARAAWALFKLGKGSNEIINVLIKLIEHYQNSGDVRSEINYLWELVQSVTQN